MTGVIYPPSWFELSLDPSARQTLIEFVRDISQWNSNTSNLKKNGTDDLIGFFYDTYGMDKGVRYVVGGLIFPDEEEWLDRFFSNFNDFVIKWEKSGHSLDLLFQASLPCQLIEDANNLLLKLETHGMPQWQD
ncbi:MAG: hypothetical protein AB7P16_30255 [Bradyrhizobium sp.]|uniref:hypothetical protein n=1 Tax=Bradyrhizobium sp. TaxID=376 RepID=UPI003D0C23BC